MVSAGETIVHSIREHALSRPDEVALVFTRGEGDEDRLTYRDLDRRARSFATRLRIIVPADALVLLPMRSDARSVVALCACLYAGRPCAPVSLPPRNGSMRQLQATAASSDCAAVVVPDGATYIAQALPQLRILAEGDGSGDPDEGLGTIRGSDLAIVQYTSGSASEPKGVLLTHANIVANLEMLRLALRVGRDDRFASWLPVFHDMGLAMVFMPLHFGVPGVLMPPLTFLRRPERWLQMLARHGTTITGAPNFAYEICARRVERGGSRHARPEPAQAGVLRRRADPASNDAPLCAAIRTIGLSAVGALCLLRHGGGRHLRLRRTSFSL